MMYIMLPVHGNIQEFTKETVFFAIFIDSGLIPSLLIKKSKNKYLMTNENEKVANHNKILVLVLNWKSK